MSIYIFILGKHPELSVAELKGRYPKAKFQSAGEGFVVFSTSKNINQAEFDHLGGAIKAANVAEDVKKDELINGLSDILSGHYQDTKLDYGLSLYGMSEKRLRPILLKLKKKLKSDGIKSRFINHNFKNISAAQYKSIKKKGIELLVVKDDSRFLIGEVVGVQDIDAYSKRDYEKPFRDMQMGMMPPKLAQILINLTGVEGKVWDPFCGSGTLIMEGLLMGREMIGSDINPRYIEGAKKNIEWLIKNFELRNTKYELLVHDATQPFKENFDAIAFEGDLGMPHNQFIKPDRLQEIIDELDGLYIRFFENLKQMKCHVPIVAALPFFRLRNGQEKDMKNTIQKIQKLGFKRTPLLPDIIKSGDRFTLKYARENQAVGRAVYGFELA